METLKLIDSGKFEKEESEKVAFLIKLFELLGYKHHQNLSFEKSTKYKGSIDGTLKDNEVIQVAIEWKGIDTKSLDRGRAGETSVDQLFRYMSETKAPLGIVGNFLEFRLYSWDKRKDDFLEFSLRQIVSDQHKLDELIFLLKPQTLLRGGKHNSILEDLIRQSEAQQEQITKRFYNDYKQRRINLFEHLIQNNPEKDKHLLLENPKNS